MSHKKPTPLLEETNRKTCPICGQRSYSAAGIHPQCAVVEADAAREESIKAARKAEVAERASNKKAPPQWTQKTCPKCQTRVHVRQKQCACGFEFPEK